MIILLSLTVIACSIEKYDDELRVQDDIPKVQEILELVGYPNTSHDDTLKYKKALELIEKRMPSDTCNVALCQARIFSLLYLKRFEELRQTLDSLPNCFNRLAIKIIDSYVLQAMQDTSLANQQLNQVINTTQTRLTGDTFDFTDLELLTIALQIKGEVTLASDIISDYISEGKLNETYGKVLKSRLSYSKNGVLADKFLKMMKYPN